MSKSLFWCVCVCVVVDTTTVLHYVCTIVKSKVILFDVGVLNRLVSKKKGHVISNGGGGFREDRTTKPSAAARQDQRVGQYLDKAAGIHERIGMFVTRFFFKFHSPLCPHNKDGRATQETTT